MRHAWIRSQLVEVSLEVQFTAGGGQYPRGRGHAEQRKVKLTTPKKLKPSRPSLRRSVRSTLSISSQQIGVQPNSVARRKGQSGEAATPLRGRRCDMQKGIPHYLPATSSATHRRSARYANHHRQGMPIAQIQKQAHEASLGLGLLRSLWSKQLRIEQFIRIAQMLFRWLFFH